jgi:dTDP-4-dehydrorhamnose reductase
MKLLLIGNSGQLGWELHRCLAPLGDIIPVDYPEFDMADPGKIIDVISQIKPTGIINASAFTAVDRAESEKDLATAVNSIGPSILADQAKQIDAFVIHFSTDYVFDGSKGSPYQEQDFPNPVNVYGQTKLEGENAIQQIDGAYLIFRTAWVYSLRMDNFVTKVLSWSRKQQVLRLVTDQISNPTWARMLAEATSLVVAKGAADPYGYIREKSGLYHLAGDGYASRIDWGKAILEYDPKPEEQIVTEILPAKTNDFPSPANRPLFSALNCDKFKATFGLSLPFWGEALRWSLHS